MTKNDSARKCWACHKETVPWRDARGCLHDLKSYIEWIFSSRRLQRTWKVNGWRLVEVVSWSSRWGLIWAGNLIGGNQTEEIAALGHEGHGFESPTRPVDLPTWQRSVDRAPYLKIMHTIISSLREVNDRRLTKLSGRMTDSIRWASIQAPSAALRAGPC